MNHSVRSSEEKVVLVWKDLTFQTLVKDPKKSTLFTKAYQNRKILKGLSGRAESKQLIAIMGPTGCGKTSLLSVLSARFPRGGAKMSSLTGSVYVNGRPRDEEHFRKISAYVMQDDNMYAHLTVSETLMMAAHFFLPSNVSDEEKANIVMSVITELGLMKAKDTIIGDEKVRGVSGGERKRVSIAVQLLTDPAVLFLDEPTSGLDAFQSQAVMEVLKNLALKGRLVISVIHQPRSSIYSMFDKLLLLSEGDTMYFGQADQAVAYFAKIGFPCPENFNPADYFLDLLSPDHRSVELEQETSQRIRYVGGQYKGEQKVVDLQSESTNQEHFVSIQHIGGDSQDLYRVYRSFALLCWRAWTEQSRNVSVILVKFIVSAFFALIIGGIFSNIGHDQRSIQNRRGVLFFITINQAFTSIQAVTSTFPNEKNVISRERSANSYTTFAYCLAKIFVEMPLNLLPVLIYCLIVHPLIGLNPDTFGYFILICLFMNFTIILLGLCISAFAPTTDAANALSPPFLIIGVLFGGFYIKISSLPIILNWIPWISAFQWSFRGLCTNEFKGLKFNCDTDPTECIFTGEEALAQLKFDHHTTSYAMFGLGMLMLCYLGGLYLLLVLNEERYLMLGHRGSGFDKAVGESVLAEDGAGVEGEEIGGEMEGGKKNAYQLLYSKEIEGKGEETGESRQEGRAGAVEREGLEMVVRREGEVEEAENHAPLA